jgi:hypothetical protein
MYIFIANNPYITLEIYFLNCQKIKSSIQVFANALAKHNYINLIFETNANYS